MAHVFISYSRQDTPTIDKLVRAFDAAAIATWVDREDIRVGAKWRKTIVDAIRAASAVLVALSPDSVVSDNVRKELDIAEEAGKPLLPVEIRSASIPGDLIYQLIGLQRIDLATRFDAGVEQLIEALRKLDESPQAFWHASPQTRRKIKDVLADQTMSAKDRQVLANLTLQLDIDQTTHRLVEELMQLDREAVERARLKDRWRAGDASVQISALDRQDQEYRLKRELNVTQTDQADKARALATAQLDAALGIDASRKPGPRWYENDGFSPPFSPGPFAPKSRDKK